LPALDALLADTGDTATAQLADALAAPFGRRRAIRAAVALALDFWTWRRLTNEGLSDGSAARLMTEAVRAATS
jgi:hypothetical protein